MMDAHTYRYLKYLAEDNETFELCVLAMKLDEE